MKRMVIYLFMIILSSIAVNGILAQFGRDSYGTQDVIYFTCSGYNVSKSVSYEVEIYKNDELINYSYINGTKYVLNNISGIYGNPDNWKQFPVGLGIDRDVTTFTRPNCSEEYIYINYTPLLNATFYEATFINQYSSLSGSTETFFCKDNSSSWIEAIHEDNVYDNYFGNGTCGATTCYQSIGILNSSCVNDMIELKLYQHGSICVGIGVGTNAWLIDVNLSYFNGTQLDEIKYINEDLNHSVHDVFLGKCRYGESGKYTDWSTHEIEISTSGTVLTVPSVDSVIDLIAGGGTLIEVLEEYNPYYYTRLQVHIPKIIGIKTVGDTLTYFEELISLFVRYVFRQSGSLTRSF